MLKIQPRLDERKLYSMSAVKLNYDNLSETHPVPRKYMIHGSQKVQDTGVTRQRALSLMTAVFIFLSTFFTAESALAAPSGGRIGGSFGGSQRQSAPTTRSYSSPGGYSRGFSQGYTTGYFSRPSLSISPFGGFGYYSPFYAPAPIISPGVGVGVISRGPGILDVFFFGIFAWILFSVASTLTRGASETFTFFEGGTTDSVLGRGVSVAQVTVALNVPNRNDPNNILNFLSRISRSANTDSREGVASLVSQVALELLRQRRSIFAASTTSKNYGNVNEAQRAFNIAGVKERSKFERETDYGQGKEKRILDHGQGKEKSVMISGATAAVITLLIAIDGDSTILPGISSISDVEQSLTRIASDVKLDSSLRSAEILWAPDQEQDVMSRDDVFIDYPKLRNV